MKTKNPTRRKKCQWLHADATECGRAATHFHTGSLLAYCADHADRLKPLLLEAVPRLARLPGRPVES